MRQYCDRGQPDSTPGMSPLALLLHICAAAAGYTQLQTLITPPCVRDTHYSNVSFQKQDHHSFFFFSVCAEGIQVEKKKDKGLSNFPKGFKAQIVFQVNVICFCLSCCFSLTVYGTHTHARDLCFLADRLE